MASSLGYAEYPYVYSVFYPIHKLESSLYLCLFTYLMYVYVKFYKPNEAQIIIQVHIPVHRRCDWVRNCGAMNGIVTPGQEVDPGGFASSAAPRGGVSLPMFPALSR